MPRYFIELRYCGTDLNGWQIQSNTPNTIQQILIQTLSVTLKHPVEIVGCGRTDSGVHAKQFFAHFDSETLAHHPFDYWIYKWNSMLPDRIAIQNIIPVIKTAHARYDAISRTYEYHIHQKKDPFLFQKSWFFPHALNHQKIRAALEILKQHKDFACFTKEASEYTHTICNIYEADWKVGQHQIVFSITANRFLRNMVRAIVGTLMGVGTEKFSLSNFEHILISKDRKKAGISAPAEALYLTKVEYPPHIFSV